MMVLKGWLLAFMWMVIGGLFGMVVPHVMNAKFAWQTHFLAGAVGTTVLLMYLAISAALSISEEDIQKKKEKEEWKREVRKNGR